MSEQRRALALAIVGSFLVFSPALFVPFLSDDYFLVRDAQVGGPLWLARGASFFRPLAGISFWIDVHLFGLSPIGYHAENILLHGLCVFAVFAIARKLELPVGTAAAGALLFLLAPVHSEPVTWISCRMDLLASAAGLLALWCWLEDRPILATVLLIAALLSKESAAPLCLIVALVAFRRRQPRKAAWPIGLLVAYVIVRRLAVGAWIGGYGTAVHADLGHVATNLFLFPLRTISGRLPAEWFPSDRPLYASPAIGVGLVAVALLLAIGMARRWRALRDHGFLLIAFALSLLPVITLSVSLVTVESERFLYLPSAFALVALAVMLRSRVAIAVVAVLFAANLQVSLHAWRSAGDLSERLLPRIADAARSRPVTLLDVPDDVLGAYVFRNGLNEALALRYPGAAPVRVVLRSALVSASDETYLEGSRLRLGDPRSWIYSVDTTAGVLVDDCVGKNQAVFRGPLPPNTWRVSGGELLPVNIK